MTRLRWVRIVVVSSWSLLRSDIHDESAAHPPAAIISPFASIHSMPKSQPCGLSAANAATADSLSRYQ